MARTPKRRASGRSFAARNQPRGAGGRFLSKQDATWAAQEQQQRSTAQRAQAQAVQYKNQQATVNRAREVYAIHAARKKRSHSKGRLKAQYRNTETQSRYQSTTKRAGFTVTLVRYHGDDALERARRYLEQHEQDKNTVGRISIGTGYGPNEQWVGSKTERISSLILYTYRVENIASASTILEIAEYKGGLWVEVELIRQTRGSNDTQRRQTPKSGSAKSGKKSATARGKLSTRAVDRQRANQPTRRNSSKSLTKTRNQAKKQRSGKSGKRTGKR